MATATATPTQNVEDIFQQAIGAWESAVDSGVRMQEEYAAWLRQMCCNSESLSEWYHKGQALAGETIVKAQENIDEAVQLMNQQAEASMKLIQKALDIRQNETSNSDAKLRFNDWWDTALDAMRTNSQAILKANGHMLATWSDLARKVNVEAADTMSVLAKKTEEQAEKMAKEAAERVKEMMKKTAGE
jgi:predicted RNase H-like HicB family nuclease